MSAMGEGSSASGRNGGGAVTRAHRGRWLALLAVASIAAWLGTGFYAVDTDEQGVVRTFGAITARVGPGMHYRLPWPVDRIDVLKTTKVMQTGVGFALPEEGDDQAVVGMELLTGDTNLLGVAVVLQFIVSKPADFLFQTEGAEALVSGLAESALTETVLAMPVDDVLTTGRLAIQEAVKTTTQRRLDAYRSGVRITSANIMTISLDKSVADAFQEVADAMADREKLSNEARGYANNTIPKARGRAHSVVREAEAFKQQRVAEAEGNTDRFLAVLGEYEKAEDVTRVRLYLEAMEKVLPNVDLYVIDSEGGKVPINLRLSTKP